jgi:hypothetical protein
MPEPIIYFKINGEKFLAVHTLTLERNPPIFVYEILENQGRLLHGIPWILGDTKQASLMGSWISLPSKYSEITKLAGTPILKIEWLDGRVGNKIDLLDPHIMMSQYHDYRGNTNIMKQIQNDMIREGKPIWGIKFSSGIKAGPIIFKYDARSKQLYPISLNIDSKLI